MALCAMKKCHDCWQLLLCQTYCDMLAASLLKLAMRTDQTRNDRYSNKAQGDLYVVIVVDHVSRVVHISGVVHVASGVVHVSSGVVTCPALLNSS
jgi:hypothetical protein